MTVDSESRSSMPRTDSRLRDWFLDSAQAIAADPAVAAISAEEAAELAALADACATGREPVDDPGQARYLASYTHTPFEVHWGDEHDALTATYFGRWSTRTALVGPWSAPVSITIMSSGQGEPIQSPPQVATEAPVIEVRRSERLDDKTRVSPGEPERR